MRQASAVTVVLFLAVMGLGALALGPGAATLPSGPSSAPSDGVFEAHDGASETALGLLRGAHFEENVGQWRHDVRFQARTAAGTAWLFDDRIEVHRALLEGSATPAPNVGPLDLVSAPEHVAVDVLTIAFPGAAPTDVAGVARQAIVVHDIGPEGTFEAIPTFEQVRYTSIHPGVDLVVRLADGHLEFDHVIAPGTDPASVGFRIPGADLDLVDGALQATTGNGAFVLHAPVTYQEGRHGREPVASAFEVTGDRVSYQLGPYDPTRPLVIDPVLTYMSYFGTSTYDHVYDVAVHDAGVDGERTVYVVGHGYTNSYPPTPPTGFTGVDTYTTSTSTWDHDGFLAKLTYDVNAQEMSGEWFARFGGSSTDYARYVDTTPSGDVVFSGYTRSTNVPTVNAVNDAGYDGSTRTGSTWSYSALIGRFTADGTLAFLSYYGGDGSDYAYGVGADGNGHLIVGGYTSSSGFPMKNAIRTTYAGMEGFVASIDTTTTPASIVFSTYIGGGSSDYVRAVNADANGIYLAGYTYSSDFPVTPGSAFTTGGYRPAWVGVLEDDGTERFFTYYDGSGYEYFYGVDGDGSGGIWVTGYSSAGIPLCPADCPPGALVPLSTGGWGGYYDAIVGHFNAAGTTLEYSSHFGGSSYDYAHDIVVSPLGMVGVTGYTRGGTGFPTVNATSTTASGYDGFILVFDPDATTTVIGDQISYSSFLGGTSSDYLRGIAADDVLNFYGAGYTYSSSGMPVAGTALQSTHAGSVDGFLPVVGKAPPTAIVSGTDGISNATSDGAALEVLTFTEVSFDAWHSVAGDLPIDPAVVLWEIEDEDGRSLGTWTGTFTDTGFGTLKLTDDGVRFVCATVYDTSPPGSPMREGRDCLEVRFLNRPPVADFQADTYYMAIDRPMPLTDLSTDKDGSVVAWEWEFHDGATDTNQKPVHQVSDIGIFPLRLTVWDDDGASDTVEHKIRMQEGPTARFEWDGAPVPMGDAVTFTDTSFAGMRPIERHDWSFDDGKTRTFTWPSPVGHRFMAPGDHDVTLSVHDGYFTDTYTDTVTVVPDEITGLDDGYETIQGDELTVPGMLGVLANDFQPNGLDLDVLSHTQPAHGTVTMDLEAGGFSYAPTDASWTGTDTFTYQVTDTAAVDGPVMVAIDVLPYPAPTAAFQAEVVGDKVVLTDASRPGHDTRPIIAWEWGFDDGMKTSERHPVHAFDSVGRHTIVLTVTDVAGQQDTAVRSVLVSAQAQAPLDTHAAPVVTAGTDVTVREGTTVMLTSDASDLHHEWTQVEGPAVRLLGADTAAPTFIAPEVGKDGAVLVFALRAYDGVSWSEEARVQVSVEHVNRAPELTVPAPLRHALPGAVLSLAATATDADGDEVRVHWSQVEGPEAELQEDADGTRALLPDADGARLVFRAQAEDGVATVHEDVVVMVDRDAAARPDFSHVAEAPGQVSFQADVPEGTALTWDFGDGSAPAHGASVVHTYREPGTYRVTLVAEDGDGRIAHLSRDVVVVAAPERTAGGDGAGQGAGGGLQTEERDDPPAADMARPADVREAAAPLGLLLFLVAAVLARARRR